MNLKGLMDPADPDLLSIQLNLECLDYQQVLLVLDFLLDQPDLKHLYHLLVLQDQSHQQFQEIQEHPNHLSVQQDLENLGPLESQVVLLGQVIQNHPLILHLPWVQQLPVVL